MLLHPFSRTSTLSDKRRLLPRPPPPPLLPLPLQPQLQLLPHHLHDLLTIASAWKVHPLT